MRFAEGGTGSVTEIPAPSAGDPSPDQASSHRRATLSLVALATSIFLTFLTVGLPLPIIPLYVAMSCRSATSWSDYQSASSSWRQC